MADVNNAETDAPADRESNNNAVLSNFDDKADDLKRKKIKSKTVFTKMRTKIVRSIDAGVSKVEVNNMMDEFCEQQTTTMDILYELLDTFKISHDKDNQTKTEGEIEKIEEHFGTIEEMTIEYCKSHLSTASSYQSVNSITSNRDKSVSGNAVKSREMRDDPNVTTSVTQVQNSFHRPNRGANNEHKKEYDLGQDMWKQLKRVSIPVFHGDKRTYENWKTAFNACIDNAPATGEYKLLQLRQYLSGDALRVIENLGHSAIAYEAAKERLERKYGGHRRQIAVYLEEIENFRPVRQGNADDLEKLADLLDVTVINLKDAGRQEELYNGTLFLKIQKKMTEELLAHFNRWMFEYRREPSVESLRDFVIQESEFQTVAAETVRGLGIQHKRPQRPQVTHQKSFFTNKSDRSNGYKHLKPCCVCKGNHKIWSCETFRGKSIAERWTIAKESRLCFRCLNDNHTGQQCKLSRECGIDGCNKTHNRLLHQSAPSQESKPESTEIDDRSHHTSNQNQPPAYVSMRTVPVILKNGNRQLTVNALLDDASTRTYMYINENVAFELGLQGKQQKTTVGVLNVKKETFNTKQVSLIMQSTDGSITRDIDAFTVDRVTGGLQVINWTEHSMNWPHLESINFPQASKRKIVDILIGIDQADLHCSFKDISGKPGQPIARLTLLGWTCIGPVKDNQVQATHFNSTFVCMNESQTTDRIDTIIRTFWEVEAVKEDQSNQIVNIEDKSAFTTVEKSLKYHEGHYQVGIPWKKESLKPCDNYDMAMKRLMNTEKRLEKDEVIAKAYDSTIEKYLEKGYIKKVEDNKSSLETSWLLPHFPVIKPDRATTKVRIVFDGSAQSKGTSLNSTIHQGPKLQRELFDVLLRFRRHPIALVCDIAEMYLRIQLSSSDRQYHRFLYRGSEKHRDPDIYEFQRVVFGVNASPFLAQYVTQQHARTHSDKFPDAAETVLKSTYMDDSMDSTPDEKSAIKLQGQLVELWKKAGMHPRKWLSNSVKVLERVPECDRASEMNIEEQSLPSMKTLGIQWEAQHDEFTFSVASNTDKRLTKRMFLSKISQIFDPIGFLGPVIITGKILMQEIWTRGTEWDEVLDDDLNRRAQDWFSELDKDIRDVRIDRCIRLNQNYNLVKMNLHTFVDASELAYGCVVYARCTYSNGKVSVRFVAAKSKVAPLNAVSMPRLELCAAILGLRLTTSISKVLDQSLSDAVFWCDSMNVLWWITGRSRNYKSFVANRVGEIQNLTNICQWNHVPTDQNPADLISRGVSPKDLVNCKVWWTGPQFIHQEEDSWPERKIPVDMSNGESKLKNNGNRTLITQEHDISEEDEIVNDQAKTSSWILTPDRYSDWQRFVRICDWVNRFVKNCRTSNRKDKMEN